MRTGAGRTGCPVLHGPGRPRPPGQSVHAPRPKAPRRERVGHAAPPAATAHAMHHSTTSRPARDSEPRARAHAAELSGAGEEV